MNHMMMLAALLSAALITGTTAAGGAGTGGTHVDLYDELDSYLDAREREFDRIDPERKALLDRFAGYLKEKARSDEAADLIFVCTHNSRRSHMSQLWAAAAAARHGLKVWAYSGGTESTAFNPRAVAAVERAGFRVVKTTEARNPVYHVSMSGDAPAVTCFSKPYDNDPNPKKGFAAVMVCGSADAACPAVFGEEFHIAVPFNDPKASDGTPEEAATYDERCADIAREMLYVMARAAG